MKKHLPISLLFLSAFATRANAQDARWGYQLSFDGTNDYFTANSISPVVSGSDWTIEFWFNSSRTVTYTEAIASFNSTTTTNRIEIGVGPSSNRPYIYTQNSSPTTLYGTTSIVPGTWYHMAIVYTASTRQIEMYLNDATTAEVTRTVPLADVVQNTDRFSLGQEWDGATASGFFAGQLDEVRIWTSARSTTQITDNLYREVAVGSTGLAAYYKMTNNAGTSVSDNTGNSRTGTLVNGTAWQSSTVTKNSNGTVSANQNIDEGESPADITISDPPYANLLWQSSPDNSNWSDISGATGTTLSSAQTGILSATTYYRARLDNGYGSFDFSDVVTVDVQQSTLAVSWLSFEALPSGSGIELRWQTAQELHASHFEMEHSVNNRDWRYLSPVAATGNSNSVQSYRFLHTNPGTGNNFYRIKEVDRDGTVSYSKTVMAVWGEANGRLLLYPNPVNNGRINLLLNRDGPVRIFNSQGVLVLQQQHSAGLKNISVSQLARGVYLLQAEGKSLQLLIQ